MNIGNKTVVTMDYTLTDDEGTVIDTSEGKQPLVYEHGAGSIIPGLEAALEGKTAGATVDAVIEPVDAYGDYDENKVFDLAMEQFSGVDTVEPGMQFQAQIQDIPTILTVQEVTGDTVTVDANHPLAGATLHFRVDIHDVSAAVNGEQ